MKAAVIHETGRPEVLSLEETERPEPGEGEVLIRIRAASVNPVDWKYRRGLSEHAIPAVGQAAAIPVAGMTAWQGLFTRGGLEGGRSALIAGAAGGVGHFAVQFARHAGARVIGTGSGRNRDFVLGLGADEFMDYTAQDVAEAVADVDVALDTVGGETTESLVPTLREGGILVTIAAAPPEAAAQARGAHAELLIMSPDPTQLSQIAGLVADGAVRVEIAETLGLDDVRRAHELSESGHTRGKLILSLP